MRRLVWAHVILCEQSGSFSLSYERRGVDTAGGTFYCIYSAGKDWGFLFLFWQREAKLLVFSLFVFEEPYLCTLHWARHAFEQLG